MNMRTMTLASALLGLSVVHGNVQAQDHSHHATPQPKAAAHDHPRNETSQAETGVDHASTDHASKAGPASREGQDVPAAKEQGAGVDHSQMDHSRMDHSGMDHSAMAHDRPPPTGLPLPPLTDADRAAAFPDVHPHTTHDQRVVSFVQFNRLEARDVHNGSGQAWEGHAWVGTDHHKLWLRSEGEREGGHTESADLEVLYGRPIAPWWDLVAGVRHDFQPGGSQTFAAIGVMGLAPYKFEVEATAYVGESGQTAARVEAEYETLLTNRLILQSLVEATAYGRDDARRGIGSGLGTVEAGLRLRYEITRKFAPYVGIAWERAYGATADLRREEGERIDDTHLVAGIRFWF
jgi:copper resistance protein B